MPNPIINRFLAGPVTLTLVAVRTATALLVAEPPGGATIVVAVALVVCVVDRAANQNGRQLFSPPCEGTAQQIEPAPPLTYDC